MFNFIDISRHNGEPDWVRLLVKRILIRATLGSTGVDDRYKINWRESSFYGIPERGAYHYFVTEAPPLGQVDNLIRVTDGDFGNIPVVIDCERRADEKLKPFDKVTYTHNLQIFLVALAAKTNHPIKIYTSANEWSAITTLPAWASLYGLHVAHYNLFIAEPDIPIGWSFWDWWQYSSTGRLAGLAGNVDLNRERVAVDPIITHAQAILELVS